jgi:hypothetical protein
MGKSGASGREESKIMSMKAQAIPATQFKAELWTTAGNSEIWAVVMLDGSEPGSSCAFGPKQKMEAYAAQLNESKGIVQP